MTSLSAEDTLFELQRSSEHNAAILSPHATLVGIARIYTPDFQVHWYWVVDLAGPGAPTPLPPAPRLEGEGPTALPNTGGPPGG